MAGYYLMHRGWQDNPVFLDEPFSRRDAWVWLIEQAAYEARAVNISGRTVQLERGQLSASIRFMARVWKWDEKRVRRFLSRGVEEQMIVCEAPQGVTVVTICNYDDYQITSEDRAAAPPQRRRKIKEGK